MSPVKEALMSNKQMYSAITVPVKTCANAMFCLSERFSERGKEAQISQAVDMM